jgi:hypothetical protein
MNRSTDANTVIKEKIHLPFPSSTFSSMCFMRAKEREEKRREERGRAREKAKEHKKKEERDADRQPNNWLIVIICFIIFPHIH